MILIATMVGVPGRSKACHTCKRRKKGVSPTVLGLNAVFVDDDVLGNRLTSSIEVRPTGAGMWTV